MNDVKFFLKCLGLTLLVVLLSQMQVGDRSVEAHAMNAIQGAAMFTPMNRVADGATKVIRDVSGKLHSAIDKNQGKRKAGEKKPSRAFNWFGHSEPEPSNDANR